MPKTAKKQTSSSAIAAVVASMPTNQAGLPSKDAITGVTVASGKYTIIHTKEVDVYEKGAMGPGLATAVLAAAPTGDDFQGNARKAAKLSISAAATANFRDVKDLVASLVADSAMIAKRPKISTGPTSKRVVEEERNVHVTAFMYAASRENDNDFHLIIGRNPTKAPEMYMTMELSGLPPATASSFPALKAARDAYKAFFTATGGTLPGLTYDYYQPPIPVKIDGSLFFDMTHATGSRPGPASLKSRMPVIWEVHPITKIVLG